MRTCLLPREKKSGHSHISSDFTTPGRLSSCCIFPVDNTCMYSEILRSLDRYNSAAPPIPAKPDPMAAYHQFFSFHTVGSRNPLTVNPAGGPEITGLPANFVQRITDSLLVAIICTSGLTPVYMTVGVPLSITVDPVN